MSSTQFCSVPLKLLYKNKSVKKQLGRICANPNPGEDKGWMGLRCPEPRICGWVTERSKRKQVGSQPVWGRGRAGSGGVGLAQGISGRWIRNELKITEVFEPL